MRQLVASAQTNGDQVSAAVSGISDRARRLSEMFTGVADATGEIRVAANRVQHPAHQVSGCSARLSGEVASLIRRKPRPPPYAHP